MCEKECLSLQALFRMMSCWTGNDTDTLTMKIRNSADSHV